MQYRRLGRTGLAVSPLCLGTMGFGPPFGLADADRLVRAALDLGINLIDTANCYDGPNRGEEIQGHAETMLGQILGEGLRDEFVLISKAGVPLREGPQNRGLSATHLMRELDNSLRRLKTDYLDVFMIHWPDPFACPEEVVRCIETAARAGKIRHFGVSNHVAWQVCEYLWIADRRNWGPPCVSELPLNLIDRRYENDLPFYVKHEIGVLAYQPLAGGRLSEKRIGNAANEGQQVSKLAGLAGDYGLSLSALAIAWPLHSAGVTAVVLGAKLPEQLQSATRVIGFSLGPELLTELDTISPGPPRPAPRFAR